MTDADAIYESVVTKIKNRTVTVDDFNTFIGEALDKSFKERVQRRTRIPRSGPTRERMFGRVVPKRTGRNDPPHQGRGKRFASGTAAKERQNQDQRERVAKEEKEKKGEGTRTYTISGLNRNLDQLEKLFHWMEYCGRVGHSGKAEVFIDGDGAARPKFEGMKTKAPTEKEMPEPPAEGPEISVGLD